ncbi:MAG: GTP-binding protein HflX [Planctomycetota bacterium]|jgi:GTP-binding protein HflX
MSRAPEPTRTPRERVLICGVIFPDAPVEFEGELSEATALAKAANAVVVGEGVVQRRARPHPATLMGKGKVEEIMELVQRHDPDAVVVDNDLTPAQMRNLEKAWCKRIIDRSELILDIFARRAKTRQAKLQVELAQNEYLAPRLRRMWTHLERTEGAIGTRGPGETQLETDRRLLRKRITDLKGQLKEIEARKRREVKSRAEQFTVGIVGYTNAGKSTLLNRLTKSDELVADMPFATLDTRTRKWRMSDGRSVLLSDTVGFLQRLPHHLVASFHATLEEAFNADLLLNVVDASHPDAANHIRAVDRVLKSLSGHLPPEIVLFNKVDRVDDPISLQLLVADDSKEVIYLSAHTGEGTDRLEQAVWRYLDDRSKVVDILIPISDGRTIARVRAHGAILEEDCGEEGTLRIRTRVSLPALGSLRREAGPGVDFRLLSPGS